VSSDIYVRTLPLMGTLVTIQVVGHGADAQQDAHRKEIVARAFDWFCRIEAVCTRFDEQSEAMRLTKQIGLAVPASGILYEAVQFALQVARETEGAFDPTVGYSMESRGFNQEYRSLRTVRTELETGAGTATFRDVQLDSERKTITLLRPLILDLGAVAKGLAVDMAARELQPLEDFSINAGGDLYVGGRNAAGTAWSVGVRHPRSDDELIDSICVSDRAVCTSGDYERRSSSEADEHHILDPRVGTSAHSAVSATVVAPSAMLADALATAAFVLGPADGIALLDRMGVDGLVISVAPESPALERYATRGMHSDYKLSGPAIFSDAQGTGADRPGDSARPSHAH
jgi:FAD:protein FMN transferase